MSSEIDKGVRGRIVWDPEAVVCWLRGDPKSDDILERSKLGTPELTMQTLMSVISYMSSTLNKSELMEIYEYIRGADFSLVDVIEEDIARATLLASEARSKGKDIGPIRIVNSTLVKNVGCKVLPLDRECPLYRSILGKNEIA